MATQKLFFIPVNMSGAQLSEGVSLDRRTLIGVVIGPNWTTANVSLQASIDNETYSSVYFFTAEWKATAAASSLWISLSPDEYVDAPFVKVRSGVAATPVTQAVGTTVTLVTRET